MSYGGGPDAPVNPLPLAVAGGRAVNFLDGGWHHIATVFDRSTLSLYVDGVLVATVPAAGSAATLGRESGDIELGGSNHTTFRGLIDDLRIWTSPLSAAEVRSLVPGATATAPPRGTSVPAASVVLDTRQIGKPYTAGTATYTVAGVNGVPAQVLAVTVSITVIKPTALASVFVYASGALPDTKPTFTVLAAGTSTQVGSYPVGADGKIAITLTGGPADVVIQVLGYTAA
jgi:hypothetical protein